MRRSWCYARWLEGTPALESLLCCKVIDIIRFSFQILVVRQTVTIVLQVSRSSLVQFIYYHYAKIPVTPGQVSLPVEHVGQSPAQVSLAAGRAHVGVGTLLIQTLI